MRATSAVGCVRYVFVGIVVALLLVVGCVSVLVSVTTGANRTESDLETCKLSRSRRSLCIRESVL